MAISEYERRRNEHVLLRAKELRKLLESSKTSDVIVNNLILGHASYCALNREAAGGDAKEKQTRRRSNPATTHVTCSEHNIEGAHIQNKENNARDEVQKNLKYARRGKVHFACSLFIRKLF
jgi:hypothetical protein